MDSTTELRSDIPKTEIQTLSASSTQRRKYNIIIFGATGFTGKYLIQETVNFLKDADESENFTWAVAARSQKKLEETLKEISKNTGEDLSSVDKVVADVSNYESLCDMARQCDIVLNCVGPYLFWGEVVVKACLQEGMHQLDLSGEAQYMERIQLLYHKEAKAKNVYILGPCGFDSIPADLGTTYLKQNFGGDLNSVELYLELKTTGGRTCINYGTYHSIIQIVSRLWELKELGKKIFPEPRPKPKYKLGQRLIHYEGKVKGWSFPNPLADQRVMERSQQYFYENGEPHPIQVKGYMTLPKLFYTLMFMIATGFLAIMAQFKYGKYLLETCPERFTFGYIRKGGPTQVEMDRQKFTFTLIGKGWNETLSKKTDVHATKPNKIKILEVKGTNPAYKATNIAFLHAALVILKEGDKLPNSGGVYTPGVAFEKTSLVERLNQYGYGESGIKFILK